MTARVLDRRHFNKIIPRITDHRRVRRVAGYVSGTLGRATISCSSLDTITIACNPNLINSLLMNIATTGVIT